MMRQIHKQLLAILLAAQVLLAAGLAAAPVVADGLVPQFVTDPLTGVALDGFDPVSYFTEPAPLPGLPDFEYDWHGVPWYFANAANRDVFIRAPETYAPQFGGHATMALSRGYLSDGNPQIYLLVAKRLYLFYSTGNRDAFIMSQAAATESAHANWSKLSKSIMADETTAAADPAHPAGAAPRASQAGTSAPANPPAPMTPPPPAP